MTQSVGGLHSVRRKRKEGAGREKRVSPVPADAATSARDRRGGATPPGKEGRGERERARAQEARRKKLTEKMGRGAQEAKKPKIAPAPSS